MRVLLVEMVKRKRPRW